MRMLTSYGGELDVCISGDGSTAIVSDSISRIFYYDLNGAPGENDWSLDTGGDVGFYTGHPTMSYDGSVVAYLDSYDPWSHDYTQKGVTVWDRATKSTRSLGIPTSDPGYSPESGWLWPSMSADGRYLALPGHSGGVRRIDLQTAEVVEVATSLPRSSPQISADGKQIVYSHGLGGAALMRWNEAADETPPATTTYGFPEGWWNVESGWANGWLEATDAASGVSRLNAFISINGGPEEPMTGMELWDLPPEGVMRIRYWAEDGAGNREAEKVAYWKSDYTPPTVWGEVWSPDGVHGDLGLSATDGLSGVDKIRWYSSADGWHDYVAGGPNPVQLAVGENLFYYYATDLAGNSSAMQQVQYWSPGPPVAWATGLDQGWCTPEDSWPVVFAAEGYVTTEAGVNVQIERDGVYLGAVGMWWMGGGLNSATDRLFDATLPPDSNVQSLLVDEQGRYREGRYKLTYRATDPYFSEGVEPPATGWWLLDNHPPSSSIATTSIAGATRLTITATDTASGVDAIRWSLDGEPIASTGSDEASIQVTETGAHTLQYSAVDVAGLAEATKTVQFEVESPVVTFPDPKLEARLRQIIGKPVGEITEYDLSWAAPNLPYVYFDLSNAGIRDLSGIEYARNLEGLEAKSNYITDISPLAELTRLTRLDLYANQITDISRLAELTKLSYVVLRDNRIHDISVLRNMPDLSYLRLEYNEIVDISPLVGNPGMGDDDLLYLNYNLLDISVGSTTSAGIAALGDRGVSVSAGVQKPRIVATAQSRTTAEDTAVQITLAGTDADGDALTYAIATQPAHGTLSSVVGDKVTYTPDANYSGPDSFTFKASDASASSAAATVSLTVTAANDAPTASAQSRTTAEDTAVQITLAGTDADGDTLTYAIATQPAHGTLSSVVGDKVTYTPDANYSGPDSFTFKASDASASSAPATVSLTVTAANDAPTASAQSRTTAEDTAVQITLAGTDADGDTLTYATATQPAHGTLSSVVGDKVTYTPDANYSGPDSFTFKASDASASSAPATVSLTVTAAASVTSIKNAGSPWETGLSETVRVLMQNGLRHRVRVRVDGGLRTGKDVVIAALLGAEEFGFGTATMISTGCVMARQCHLNTCPTGVATQDETLRKRFRGTADGVSAYFQALSREVREILASLGAGSLNEIIGRTELLTAAAGLPETLSAEDLGPLLLPYPENSPRHCAVERNDGPPSVLNDRLANELGPAIKAARPVAAEYAIRNVDRSIPVRLNYLIACDFGDRGLPEDTLQLRFLGTAGQSFGAFNHRGLSLTLVGDANDYAGKGMFGGRISIVPSDIRDEPHQHVIVGNTVLYGAVGGEFYAAGRAGERFGVRNSGARAVIEGAGLHLCEYMTRGVVVVLGDVGGNVGAGMTGGVIYIQDREGSLERSINRASVRIEHLDKDEDIRELRDLVIAHFRYTGSMRADDVITDLNNALRSFKKVVPLA